MRNVKVKWILNCALGATQHMLSTCLATMLALRVCRMINCEVRIFKIFELYTVSYPIRCGHGRDMDVNTCHTCCSAKFSWAAHMSCKLSYPYPNSEKNVDNILLCWFLHSHLTKQSYVSSGSRSSSIQSLPWQSKLIDNLFLAMTVTGKQLVRTFISYHSQRIHWKPWKFTRHPVKHLFVFCVKIRILSGSWWKSRHRLQNLNHISPNSVIQ